MFTKISFAVPFVTVYLLVYYLLFDGGASADVIAVMFFLSPFLVAWMVITILKHDKYKGKQLSENEEWGYADKEKDSLGIF